MNNYSEEQLIIAAKSDPEAFAKLYDLYYSRILNYFAHRTADPELAADLTSETFYSALKTIKNFKAIHKNSFAAWLFKIANNILNKHYRKSYKMPIISWILEKFDPPAPTIEIPIEELKEAENLIENSNLVKKIRKAIIELTPEKYRQIISMFYFDNLGILEIASNTGLSESNVKTTLHRARQKLKTICNEEI